MLNMNQRLVEYIENSFLKPLLEMPSVTDISYNGVAIFYMDNLLGRKKAKFEVKKEEAMDFIRQIANLSERQFSFSVPTLDVSVSRYRINAEHSSVVRVNDDKSISFSIRIASTELRISDHDKFMEKEARKIIFDALDAHKSIVIAGPTGSGKTEFQKYLISKLEDNSRIIIIDNIQELDYVRFNENLDITSWQISPTILEGNAQSLIRNALRNNPDWLVVAESRGKEMADALNAVMTGHPIITTLHAESIELIPRRMMRMVQMNNYDEPSQDILSDIYTHIPVFVHLGREIKKNKHVVRYVDSIALSNGVDALNIVYKRKSNHEES